MLEETSGLQILRFLPVDLIIMRLDSQSGCTPVTVAEGMGYGSFVGVGDVEHGRRSGGGSCVVRARNADNQYDVDRIV